MNVKGAITKLKCKACKIININIIELVNLPTSENSVKKQENYTNSNVCNQGISMIPELEEGKQVAFNRVMHMQNETQQHWAPDKIAPII